MNILIVHEDKGIVEYLQKAFKEEIIIVDLAQTFAEALEKYYLNPYDILIIGDEVQNIAGKNFCEKIRNDSNKVGLLCISSKDDIDIKVELFKAGLDDYILKPFKFIELLYRVRALYRRVSFTEIMKKINLTFQDFKLDMMSRQLSKNDDIIELTQKEFALIELLARNRNLALSRTFIREKVWGIDFVNNTNIVDVYINKIRKKIKDDKGKILQSVRGYGYILKD